MKALLARIPSIYFILTGTCLMGAGWIPIIRAILPLNQQYSFSLATIISLVIFWIAGLMAGLTGLIQLARKENSRTVSINKTANNEHNIASLCHLSGLLFYIGIPFANFFICFLLWQRYRSKSLFINQQGIQAVNFQITHALYLLLSLFLVFAFGFGVLMIGLLSIFHIVLILIATITTLTQQSAVKKPFSYPANIKII